MLFRRVGAAALLALVLVSTALRAGILEDRGVEDAIARSFVFRELLIDPTMVRCYVRYGIVELRGQVCDESERDLLTYYLSAVPDVQRVENFLFVDSDARRTGARWSALRLRSQLLMLAGIDARLTRVEVVGEQWQLVGEFDDEASLQNFSRVAQSLAPKVLLTLTLRTKIAAALKLAKIDDASIAAIVRTALESASLSLSQPAVTCAEGKVTLRGFVRNAADIERARQIAAATRGVLAVDNRLALQP